MISLSPVKAARPGPQLPVGIGRDAGKTPLPLGALRAARGVVASPDSEGLLSDLLQGKTSAAVRGTLSAADFWAALSGATGKSRLQRGVLLEPKAGRGVLLGPVGIAEGRGPASRTAFAKHACRLLETRGLASEAPLVAVLSFGRPEDGGRGAHIARSLGESARVVEKLQAAGLDAFSAGVQIEDVIADADVVVMPDGASGNLAFRALHLIGKMASFGAPVLGTKLTVVDTSRERASYEDPVRLAAFLASSRAKR